MTWVHFPASDENIGVIFNPDNYGFSGVWPLQFWSEMQTQFSKGWSLATGEALVAIDQATRMEKYPLRINLWDFICDIHATMMVGEEGLLPPRATFSGAGSRAAKRAATYTELVSKVWRLSKPSKLFTAFYQAQAFGGAVLAARIERDRKIPVSIDLITPFYFYPVFDSSGNILEYFIYKDLSHREALYRYGVTIPSTDQCRLIEHWNPTEYSVKVNAQTAKFPDGTPMRGSNPFGMAPAVYIPHIRKTRIYGDSQIIDLEKPVLEFNARAADVTRAVRDSVNAKHWGRNLTGNAEPVMVGPVKVHNLGSGLDRALLPEIFPFKAPENLDSIQEVVSWLWDLILHLARIPQVALGVDEGSQRSGQTLRARFWALRSHCSIERAYASSELDRLSVMIINGLAAMRYPGTSMDAEELEVTQDWSEMLPQDRAELVNEMVQRKATGLVSTITAVRKLGGYQDLDEELKEIESEREFTQQKNMEVNTWNEQ
jgi:hypothetical protein